MRGDRGGVPRLFRFLLAILPASFRRRFGDEMEASFGQRLEEARRRGRGPAVRLWARTSWDLAYTAVRAWPRALVHDPFTADVRHALRGLRKQPAFTVLAVMTAALGIGANTAVFSVVKAVLLDPLPVRAPSRLVRVWSRKEALHQERYFVSPSNYAALGERARSFEALGAWVPTELTILPDGGDPVRVSCLLVSVDLFRTLGVDPVVGRSFIAEEAEPGPAKGVLLSYAAWQEIFGGDRHVLEREIRVGGPAANRVPVVGVLPAGLDLPEKDVQIFLPLRGVGQGASRFDRYLNVVGRLAPGATAAGAQHELNGLARGFAEETPAWNRGWDYQVEPLKDVVVGGTRPILLILLGGAALVMLVACANLAGLLLGRAEGRRREVALRSALGAARGRIVRQLVTESLVLAGLGGMVGVGWARLCLDAVRALAAVQVPRLTQVGLSIPVLAFTAAMTFVTGVLFGLAPAIRLAGVDAASVLKEGGRSATAGRERRSLRSVLVAAQLAVSVVLVVSAGLVVRSFTNLVRTDPGFDAHQVVTAELSLRSRAYASLDDVAAFYDQLLARARQIPGVRAVGLASTVPFGPAWDYPAPVETLEHPVPVQQDRPRPYFRQVDEGFFRALRIPLLEGRTFTPDDRADASGVVVVNRAAERLLWPGEDALGKELDGTAQTFGSLGTMLLDRVRVVGVVGDVKYDDLATKAPPAVYFPFRQAPFRTMSVVLRIQPGGRADAVVAALRREVRALDPTLAVSRVATMETRVAASLARQRLGTLLLGGFAALALILAAVGIYGVVSHEVARRTGEIGIRRVLGAGGGAILGLVLERVLSLSAAGLGAGLLGALAATRFIGSQLYGVGTTDPATFAGVTTLLALVCLGAALVPAWRALRADPAATLRLD